MILKSDVLFNISTCDNRVTYDGRIRYNNDDAYFILSRDLESKGIKDQLEEIKLFCNNIPGHYHQNKKTYSFECERRVYVYQENRPCSGHRFYDPQTFKFIMSTTNDLIYPKDVREFFDPQKKFCEPEHINGGKLAPNVPVYIASSEWWCNRICRPLDNNDIVVDINLRQIYPKNDDFGKIPCALHTLLLKTKCIFR